MIHDPINFLENSDDTEVRFCRHCRSLIEPGHEQEWNGWSWHYNCLPTHVHVGREQEARDDERRDDER